MGRQVDRQKIGLLKTLGKGERLWMCRDIYWVRMLKGPTSPLSKPQATCHYLCVVYQLFESIAPLMSLSRDMFSSLQSLFWTASIYVKTIWLTFYAKVIWSVVTDTKPVGTEQRNEPKFSSPEDVLAQIKAIRDDHETAGLLQHLIEADGAGNWPPQASHGDAWPTALRPYHNIYLELAPSLPVREVSLDNEINSKRCLEYRTRMRKLLHDCIDLSAVKAILLAVEAGDKSALPVDAYNGFFACIALSRHAFR